MTSHSPATKPKQCQNGTIWNGEECFCAPGFVCYLYQSPVDSFSLEIPEKINATVGVKVKVTNCNFTTDLNNVSSQAYLNFSEQFKKQMDEAYKGKDFPHYGGLIIRRLLNGSVVVEFDVILEANYTSAFEGLFANLIEIVKTKTMNETKRLHPESKECKGFSTLCFNEEATTVSKTVKLGFDLKEQCSQKAAKDLAAFYYVEELNGKPTCVTKCTSGTKSQLNCHQGKCQLEQSGPRCLCPTSDTHWHLGETCGVIISKSMVYWIVGAVVVLLLILVVALSIFLSRSQRKLHQQEHNLFREWQKEGILGSFQNAHVWEDQNLRDRFGLANAYNHFRPSLGNIDSNTEFHIERPQAVTPAP
nr:mucin-12 [Equus caballus]